MQTNYSAFEKSNTEILAISTSDSQSSAEVRKEMELSFESLSDSNLQAIRDYGVEHPNGFKGKSIARPAEFLIDSRGEVAKIWLTSNWRIRTRAEDLLVAVKELAK